MRSRYNDSSLHYDYKYNRSYIPPCFEVEVYPPPYFLLQISPLNALDMMLTGKNIKPDKAKKWGLVDGVVDPVGRHLIYIHVKFKEMVP